jgi:hypothetical protein
MKFFEWLSNILWIHNGTTEVMDIDFDNGIIDVRGTLNVGSTKIDADKIALLTQGVAGGYKIARGQRTMLSASDTVATGLATVVSVVASMDSDPILTCDRATASIGNQTDAPIAGSVYLKVWMPTATGDATPAAASGFAGIKVNWIAIGT